MHCKFWGLVTSSLETRTREGKRKAPTRLRFSTSLSVSLRLDSEMLGFLQFAN